MIAKLIRIEHRVEPPAATLRGAAVHRLQNFRPHANVKQLHPLVRSFENPRIVPGQPSQVLTVNVQLSRRFDEVAEMPRQYNRRSLIAEMGKSRRPLWNMRHVSASGFTLGRAIGSGGISSTTTSRNFGLDRL